MTLSERLTQRGIVLPVVLVMLVLMTTVVLYLMRRGVVDERMASNVRGITTVDTAAQYALRWCELWLWTSPPGIAPQAGRPNPPRTMLAPANSATAAWRDSANWPGGASDRSVDLPATAMSVPDVTVARCLIEDASAELELGSELTGNRLEFANTWRKYRVTAEVGAPGPGGQRIARAQSEIRMNVN
jgi:Tfp pilus assembly protein PilX